MGLGLKKTPNQWANHRGWGLAHQLRPICQLSNYNANQEVMNLFFGS